MNETSEVSQAEQTTQTEKSRKNHISLAQLKKQANQMCDDMESLASRPSKDNAGQPLQQALLEAALKLRESLK